MQYSSVALTFAEQKFTIIIIIDRIYLNAEVDGPVILLASTDRVINLAAIVGGGRLKKQDFKMYAGDTKDIVVTVKTASGAVVDLSSASVKWALKRHTHGPHDVFKKTGGGGITITDVLGGVFTVRLNSIDTKDLHQGRYYHEAEVTDMQGNVSTVMTGTVTLEHSGV